MNTTLKKLTDLCNSYGIKYNIEYDHARQFKLTFKIPMHYVEVIESYIDNDMLLGCDVTTHYSVYRNESHVFSGNDMYSDMFILLFETFLVAMYSI